MPTFVFPALGRVVEVAQKAYKAVMTAATATASPAPILSSLAGLFSLCRRVALSTQFVPKLSEMYKTLTLVNPMACSASSAGLTLGQWLQGASGPEYR